MADSSSSSIGGSYRRGEPYIFVCYAHADDEIVYKDIAALEASGINIWFDQSISPGHEWREDIAEAIQNCSLFVAFLSPSSLSSPVCKKEIAYASQSGKPLLSVYLEPVTLSPGIELAIGDVQALFRHKLESERYKSELLSFAQDALARRIPRSAAIPRSDARKRSRNPFVITAVILVLLAVYLGNYFSDPGLDRLESEAGKAGFEFKPRQWAVLVFDNQTTNSLLDGSVETALRVALQQSRYVNIASPARVREGLKRMDQSQDSPLDRDTGLELALREGLAAVIETEVSESADDYVLTASILDPQSRETVFERSLNASDDSEILPRLETLAESLRTALGEPEDEIRELSTSLEEATTSSLEALKVYSDAIRNSYANPMEEKIEKLEQALVLDPEFALAHAEAAMSMWSIDRDLDLAKEHWESAARQFDRLTRRERLYIDATRAYVQAPEELRRKWQLFASIYPDARAGHHHLGVISWLYYNDFEKAAQHFQDGIALADGDLGATYYFLAYCQLALGEPEVALRTFQKAGETLKNMYGIVDALLILEKPALARQSLIAGEYLSPAQKVSRTGRLISLAIEEGRLLTVYDLAVEGQRVAREARSHFAAMGFAGARLAISEASGDSERLAQELASTLDIIRNALKDSELWLFPSRELSLTGKVAARNGDLNTARLALELIRKGSNHRGRPILEDYEALLEGEVALAEGEPERALALFSAIVERTNLFQAHESLARAYASLGDKKLERQELMWLATHKGQAFAEISHSDFGRELSLLAAQAAAERLADDAVPAVAKLHHVFPGRD